MTYSTHVSPAVSCRPAPYEGLYGRHDSLSLDNVYGGDRLTAVNLASSEQQRSSASGGGAAGPAGAAGGSARQSAGSAAAAASPGVGAGQHPFQPGSPPPGDLLARLSASGPSKTLSASWCRPLQSVTPCTRSDPSNVSRRKPALAPRAAIGEQAHECIQCLHQFINMFTRSSCISTSAPGRLRPRPWPGLSHDPRPSLCSRL